MRRAIIAVLALAGCSQQGVQPIGLHQYMVTAPPKQQFPIANETCAKLGRMMVPSGTRVEDFRPDQFRFECRLAFEIVPAGKDSYKIWVPTSAFPPLDGCETCVPPHPPTVQIRVKELASDYCRKMNLIMKETGGYFDLGIGLELGFTCVPSQQKGASP